MARIVIRIGEFLVDVGTTWEPLICLSHAMCGSIVR